MLRINFLGILAIIFLFMNDCRIKIGSQQIIVGTILTLAFFGIYFFLNPGKTKKFKTLFTKPPVMFLGLLLLWILVSPVFVGKSGVLLNIWFSTFLTYGCVIFPTLFFAAFFVPKYISFQKVANVVLGVFLFSTVYGIIDYYGQFYSISAIEALHNYVSTRSMFLNAESTVNVTYFAVRNRSFCFEPSFYALFLFVMLPFALKVVSKSYKITRSRKVDAVLKVLILTLTYVNLFLTQSPIYIIASMLFTFLYFSKDIIRIIRRRIVLICCAMLLIVPSLLFIPKIDNPEENRIVRRVNVVASSFKDVETLILTEPSLGARIVAYINAATMAGKHPITGITRANDNEMYTQFKNSPVPLTEELYEKLEAGKLGSPPSIFWATLLENGIIGLLLIYSFFISTIWRAFRISKFFVGNDRIILEAFSLVGVNFVVNSIYQSFTTDTVMWFVFGVLTAYSLTLEKCVKYLKIRNRENILKEDLSNVEQRDRI